MRERKYRAWIKKLNLMGKVASMELNPSVYGVEVLYNDEVGFFSIEDVELLEGIGLKDKNGEEVYEGDVLRYGYVAEYNTVVEYCDYLLKYQFKNMFGVYDSLSELQVPTDAEVIGNIYENPELLDQED